MAADDPLPDALKFAAENTIAKLPGFDTLWSIWGKLIGEDLASHVGYLRIKLHALEPRVKHLPQRILTSPEFAKRAHQVFLALARTTQEEKRRHMCHALARYAAGEFQDEDEVTLLLPLVEALSVRHFIVLEDLLSRCDPSETWCPRPEEIRLPAVWGRLKEHFPADDGRHFFDAILADLEGRGLLVRPHLDSDAGDQRGLVPSLVAKRLLAFVKDPAPAGERNLDG